MDQTINAAAESETHSPSPPSSDNATPSSDESTPSNSLSPPSPQPPPPPPPPIDTPASSSATATATASASTEDDDDDDDEDTATTTTTASDPALAPDDTGPEDPAPVESTIQPLPKRRRKRKRYAGIPSSMVLRPHSKSFTLNDVEENQIHPLSKHHHHRRRRRASRLSDLSKDLDVETLIAFSVGFPIDSLTEEEIEANVVSSVGGSEQSHYIVVRNHILSRWRSDASTWITAGHVLESVRPEHRYVVDKAYQFLLEHGFINFGLSPEIKRSNMKSIDGSNVLIIGAGFAGLTAARQLVSMGFKVLILEGRTRPGGRVKTRKMQGGGVVAAADLGGSVLTGINGNPLGVIARQLGFPLHKVRDICPLYLPDGKAVDPDIDSRVEATFNKLLDRVCKLRQVMVEEVKCVDVSLGTALEAFRKIFGVAEDPQERMLLDWHLANLEYANASQLANLSMAFWDQDDPHEMGGDHCFIPGGNERFIRALAEGLPILYGRMVECVRYGPGVDDGVSVYAGSQEFRADMVLCTVPLGVLKRGTVEFEPELPQKKRDAIDRLGFGCLNKVAMLFPCDFWGGEIDTFGHLSPDPATRGEFFLFYSYSSVSGGPLLVALVAGEAAIKFEKMSPVDAVEKVLDILRGIFNPKGIDVPDPIQVVCTQWGQDHFTYGSYSHVAIGSSGDDYDILAETVGDGRVFFAGEATNKQYPATMHGAFLSGMREAAKMLKAARTRTRTKTRSQFPESDDKSGGGMDDDDESLLGKLFMNPDMEFGNFSVLHDPRSNNNNNNNQESSSSSLLRVGFGTNDPEVSMYLYGILPRSQVPELSKIDGDVTRLRVLNQQFGVRLVGRAGLSSDAIALLASIRSARMSER
ncbi:Lysine-specific histone demethylase 1 1 [Dionaea muscipula]